MKKFYSVVIVCISMIICSSAAGGIISASEQIVWEWSGHSDQICVVERAELTLDSCEITGVDSGPGVFIKKIWTAFSLPENSLAKSCQVCRGSFLPKSKLMDVNFRFTKNTVDSVLYYAVGTDSPNSLKRPDLF